MFPFRRDILEEHADEAAFLVQLRVAAFSSPTETFETLAFQDERLIAHLDGLAVAGAEGWRAVRGALTSDKPREVFVGSWTAFAVNPDDAVDTLTCALDEPARWGALRWSARLSQPEPETDLAARLLESGDARLQALGAEARGLTAEAVPDDTALEWLRGDHPLPRKIALAAALRRRSKALQARVAELLSDTSVELDTDLVAAGFALGVPQVVPAARAWMTRAPEAARDAVSLLAAAGGEETASILVEAARVPALARSATLALGRLGDPRTLPVLVEAASDPLKARAAGQSLERMLGVNLTEAGLTQPEAAPLPPDQDFPEEDLALDLDEDFPVPDAAKLRDWWQNRSTSWGTGARLLRGGNFTFQPVLHDARHAALPDREAALHECFFRIPGLPYPEPRGWAHVQARTVTQFLQQAEAGAALALRATKGWPTVAAS